MTVFVTKASSCRAVVGRGRARRGSRSRSGGSTSTGPSTQRRCERAVELDDAAVAGAVAARHRRLPGELGGRDERAHRLEHRLGPAREHVAVGRGIASVTSTGSITTSAFGTSAAASAWCSLRKPSTAGGRSSASERYGSGAIPIPPPTSSGRGDVEAEAVAERAEDGDLVAGLERGERARAGPDRVDQERELAARREAERHRPRQHPARRLEHEELARDARLEHAALRRAGARTARSPRSATGDATSARDLLPSACRSWSDSGRSARAFAIASTAARATASVVMHGTRATTAASRIA